jgi:hypothetical protein
MNEENTDKNKLYLKTIYELLGEKFYIPAYQRGYRWSAIQVRELLDDIWEFSQNSGDKASFYCLQPVVVVQSDSHWEVVDGQQRLTTLYVILHYLEKEHLRRELNEAYKKPLFSLEYETRPESKNFLKNIQKASADTNIDFYHIATAYEEVRRWFSDRDYNENNDFLSTLLAKPDTSHSVKVIWYDLTDECRENDYAIDVFSRINIGKIPLTNAELVKALFLQSSHFHKEKASLKQVQIATEWDAIEKSLQESSFWHFIYKPRLGRRYDSRIEYIFDLMKDKPSGAETFYTFHEFNAAFRASKEANGQVDIDDLWKGVKDYFLTFDEWYRDRDLYHLIGFLVDCGYSDSVRGLKAKSDEIGSTKADFKVYLKKEIRKEVNCQLDGLSYGETKLRKVLLLFNIQTLLSTKEADVRFPFDRYKKEKWDIEHIRSQTDKEITGASRREWLEDVLEYFTNTRDHTAVAKDNFSDDIVGFVRNLIELLSAEKVDDASFKSLYREIASLFKEDVSMDGIGNLALLDATTNRSYKNAMFPIKRKRIIHNDMNGVFVPICTKNVFLKFYSKKLGEVMYWNDSDADDYLSAIKQVLTEYLPDQERTHG